MVNSLSSSNQIVFVDSRVQDIPSLLAGLPVGIEVHTFDASLDGLAQMLDVLAGRSGIDAIHLFGHGSSGSAQLGSTTLSNANLGLFQTQLAQIGQSLTATGDLLLYGCNVAQGDAGQALIEQIAQFTGADVAASTDLTGAAALGGDWVLEAQAGGIETTSLNSENYDSVLGTASATFRFTNTALGTGTATVTASDAGGTSSMGTLTHASNVQGNFSGAPVSVAVTGVVAGQTWNIYYDKGGVSGDYPTAGAYGTITGTGPGTVTANISIDYSDTTFFFKVDAPPSGGGGGTVTPPPPPPPPANTAPTAGSGSSTINEGATGNITLSTSNTSASDPEGDALTFTPGSVSYSAGIIPGLKGTVNGVSTSSYTVTDTGSLTGTGGVFTWNVTYADDPTTWGSGPSNQNWITSGTNSYQLSGASDPDDGVSYSIVSGAPNWVHISGGQIYGNVAPEFASQTYNLTVRAQGSNAVDKTFSITTGTTAELNDVPTTSSAGARTVAEDAPTPLTFAAANFNFADLDNTVGGSSTSGAVLTSIRIDSLTSHGTLKLGSTNVQVGDVIAAVDIGTLTYTSNTDYSGSDSYTYSVNDGIAWSATPTNMTITITPSNDAPVLVDGRPILTTITENDTTNAGTLVSDLISLDGLGGTNPSDKTGVTDVDTLNNNGLGNAPESVGQGIAIFSAINNNRVTIDEGATFTDYGTGGGSWEYSTNGGTSWTAVGTVSGTQALLLSATDKLRFVPDTANGTMGTLNYYLWDGANGTTHDTRVDVSTRGDATPYSLLSDAAFLVVSNVNDAPVLDLDGNDSSGAAGNSAGGGASFATEFLVRGTAVAIADTDMTIGDVDSTGGVTGPTVYDTVASATVAITAGATDNLFGTTYETLTAASTSVIGSLGTITISNSGTASISISGAGTWAEYQDIIKAITYQNANPNAYPGARTVTVSIVDSATTDTGTPATVSATSTITNVWAPSVDTNGVASGVTLTTAYTEGGAAVKIVTADATITDQDSHLKQVVVSISNVQNAGSETLTIPGGNGANWNGITGLTVTGSGTSTITLTGDLPPNDYQLALRSISYANSSDAPGTTQRDITVVVTDINDHVGDTGHSYINLTPVNDAPVLGAAVQALTAIAEDVATVDNTGNTVASLINDGRITDPDLGSGVPKAIAVSAADNTNGTWQYQLAAGTWTAFDFTTNSGKALLLDSTDSVRFVPTADWNGTVAAGITFYAWDKTSSAVAGDYLTVSGNTGGTQVLSTATGTFDITVTPVNDAPVLSGSGSDMTAITEDATDNAGQAVSAFLATVNDIDSATQGIAVYSTTVTGPTSGGKWQFKVNAGNWTDFGTVSEGAALLLKSTDLVRFVPDTQNGQTASFDYYAWDQHSGTAGGTADVATRGGNTAFSTASDSASITVTDLNDAPVLDLNTSTDGNNYSTNFLVRSGVGVAVANTSGISIADVDVTGANVPESIAGAVVAITAGAVDNTFGTIYETLTSGSGASVTSSLGNNISISGSGTHTITISGAGTPTEYQNIIKAITYENANPNAYTGARTVTVTLTDSALTGGSAGTATATTTITNLWAPVVDTNGVATDLVTINGVTQQIGAGVKYVTSYTQGGSPAKVATADATITDEDSYLQSVVVSIHDAAGALVANAFEKLTITLGNTSNWNGLGLTVAGSGTDTITLSGNLPPSIYQLALRSISYANTSPAPGEVTRTIHVVATDIDNHVGYTGFTDINVIPVNSPPTLAAVANSGSVAEDALASTTADANLSGTLVGNDIETAAGDLIYGVSGGVAGSGADAGKVIATGTYGSLKVTTSGGAFEFIKNATAIEALAHGGNGQDVFTVTVADGTVVGSLTNTSPPTNGPTRTYTVNVTGANDAPLATGAYTHTITDSAAQDTFADLTGSLVATDVDTTDTLTWSGSAAGSYGALTVNANGSYSYVVNAAAVNALQTGSNTTDNFTVTVTDSQGATATRTVAMTVVAANDTPVATGTYTHTITDTAALDTFANLTGSLVATDVDTADTLTWSGSAAGSFGALTVNANGSYSYVVNAAAVNALQTGSNTTDNFTVTVTDSQGATATRTIAMTVVAANDTPVVSNNAAATVGSVTEAGHLDNGQAVLNGMGVDGLSHVTGQLSATDVDTGDTQTWSVVGAPPSTVYGTFSINAATGLWDFALNNYLPATQALKEGDVVNTSYTARVTDGLGAHVDQTVTLTITGTNDVPVVANDAAAQLGTVTEAGTSVIGAAATSAQLSASDVDASATQTWSLVGTPSAAYGSMVIDASTGAWTFTLDNTKAATQALAANQSVVETFTARVTDDKGAFVNQTISVTIDGNDDQTVITGTSTATVAETDVAVTTGGTLIATDPDSSNAFVVQTDVAGSNGFGKFSISNAGLWSYTTNTAHNEFVAGTNYTDAITVATADGTTQVVTVMVAGSNDAAVISGTSTASLTETDAVLTTTGSLSATDVDSATTFVVQTDVAGSNGHGKFSINAAGEWTYATNNAHDEFLLGTTYTDTLTVATADGSTQVLTVNMAGSYDASYIQGLGTDHVVVFNDGATPTNLDGLPAGTTVTVQGTGTITITAPLGNISVINEGSGTVTVSGAPAGSTLTTGGTGPIVVTTALSAGQTLVVNTNANPNVQIDHSGGGLVEIQGNVALFAGANMAMVLNGNGTTVLSETGTVDLRNAPLKLSLASTYRPALGDNITLIANDNGDPVQGTFANLPEGSVVQVGNTSFRLSYQGGTDANDVVLKVVNTPHSGAVSIAGPSTVGSTLVASNSLLDADGIPLLGSGAISYQWLADNVAIPGARAATHVLTDADLAKAVKVIASYTDALGTPESQDSAATMVRAAATTGTEPKAQEALVSSIEVTPTTGNTTVVSLALNTGVNAGLANDSVKVQASTAVTAPSIFEAPLGVFDLTASGTTTGGEKFSLFVDKALAVNGYWVQNAAGVFVNLASPVYGGSTVIEGDKIRLDFTVQDGGQFDSAAVTGTIEASGAAARMELSIVGHTADVPTGGVFF